MQYKQTIVVLVIITVEQFGLILSPAADHGLT